MNCIINFIFNRVNTLNGKLGINIVKSIAKLYNYRQKLYLYPNFSIFAIMIFLNKLKYKTIISNILFWIVVWFFFFYFFNYNSDNISYSIWFSSFLLPLTIIVTYISTYNLIPNLLLKRRYLKFALYCFYLIVFASYMIVLIIYGCLIFVQKFDVKTMPPMSKNFMFIIILVFLIVFIIGFINILTRNFSTDTKNRELQNRILEAQLQLKEQEINYLKMQIHPHFLFNTLNTIYGLAINKSEYTPDVILKLSNLLDYILYKVTKPKVSLYEEVEHIKEYIELERIRFQESLSVDFHADSIRKDIEVSPMLLIPLVENAFKHGEIVDGYLNIEIKIHLNNNTLEISVINSVQDSVTNSPKGGIGLSNIRKRLELNYKNNHRLDVSQKNDRFIANLVINNINSNYSG